ncbi:uncharacterized protein LOC109818715 [Cajanus cajan]|uniref:Endonuclease/exonuclease/phosphatase domain-containing protein n=1 Tax=Cajanus cajan TaxID=3821 RepID=A0A151RHF5_CAJCA|nr:uncharacterized protein LOC109818715 [Cajanus cajan]KYP41999.1 hypothetical protein KK1_036615 [Cajanus cajan]
MGIKEKVDVLCLHETKREEISEKDCQGLWGGRGERDIDWKMTPAVNKVGGLLCVWCKEKLKVSDSFQGSRFLGLVGIWRQNRSEIVIVNIYAPCDPTKKKNLWGELKEIREQSNIKVWCVVGDFNCVRKASERVGVRAINDRRDTTVVRDFNKFISDMDVVDIPLSGRSFTWYRPNGSAKSQIDRILVSREWFDIWPGSSQVVLNKSIFDSFPIMVRQAEIDWGPKPFKVFDHWMQEKDFRRFVIESWNGT